MSSIISRFFTKFLKNFWALSQGSLPPFFRAPSRLLTPIFKAPSLSAIFPAFLAWAAAVSPLRSIDGDGFPTYNI